LFALLGLIPWLGASAQTNIFPSSGSVGIGTTSPGSFDLNIQNSTSANVAIGGYLSASLLFGNNGWSHTMGIDSSDRFFLESNGTDYFLATWDGGRIQMGLDQTLNINGPFVGIGTASPSFALDVCNNGFNAIRASGNSTNSVALTLTDSVASGNAWGVYSSGGGPAPVGDFGIYDNNHNVSRLVIDSSGNVGIGTTAPTYPLSVNGTVEAKEVVVQTGWSDYVFDQGRQLQPLGVVAAYIRTQHRLPGMPSAAQVAAKGVSVGDTEAKLLAQVEELTLRAIDQEKRMDAQQAEIALLTKDLSQLRKGGGDGH
jgi:hypothetical protein